MLFTKRGIDANLSKGLSHIYDSCSIKKTKYWSCIILKISGKSFGKINLCFYRNTSGKYRLTDGGFIFNHIVQGKLTAEDIIPDINKFMINQYGTSFAVDGNVILFKVHNSYTSLSKGVASFFMLLTFIVSSINEPK